MCVCEEILEPAKQNTLKFSVGLHNIIAVSLAK